MKFREPKHILFTSPISYIIPIHDLSCSDEPKQDERLILKQCDACMFYIENKLDRTMAGCTKNDEFADINRLTSFCGNDGKLFELTTDTIITGNTIKVL